MKLEQKPDGAAGLGGGRVVAPGQSEALAALALEMHPSEHVLCSVTSGLNPSKDPAHPVRVAAKTGSARPLNWTV